MLALWKKSYDKPQQHIEKQITLPTRVQIVKAVAFPCFLDGSVGKESAYNAGRVQSLGREDPLEKEIATHFSNFAWEISWTEESGGLQSTESQESDTT